MLVAHGDILRRVIQEEYPWTNAEVRLFQFAPDQVDSDDPVLFHVADIAAGGRTDADLDMAAEGKDAYPANSAPTLPELSNSGTSLSGGTETESGLSSIEERVKQMYVAPLTCSQASVESQANELEDLDRRLAEAEAKKAELESNV